jgi:hypothetical protein
VSGYEKVVGDTFEFPLNRGDVYSVYAPCSPGKVAVGGGYELLFDGQRLTVLASVLYDDAGYGCRVDFKNNTTAMVVRTQVKAYALCVTAR